MPLADVNHLRYVPMPYCSTQTNGITLNLPYPLWANTKKIIDKVYKHVCRHAEFSDFKIILERNELWSDQAAQYLSEIIKSCNAYSSTSYAKPNRKVSISSLSNAFNPNLCIGHFYFDEIFLIHFMEQVSRFSTAQNVENTNHEDVICDFESAFVSHFWYPETIQGDKAFKVRKFRNHINILGILFEVVPKGRHYKNPTYSKHGIIRSVSIRLINDENSV